MQVQHGLPCTMMSPAPSVSSLLLWASGFQEAPEPLFVKFPDLVYFLEAEAWAWTLPCFPVYMGFYYAAMHTG